MNQRSIPPGLTISPQADTACPTAKKNHEAGKTKKQENSNAKAAILKNADVNTAKNILRNGMKMLRITIPDIRNVTREQILVAQFMVAIIEAERVLKWRVRKEKERAAEHAVTTCGAGRASRQRRDKQAPAVK